jgi:hypothetical protein
MDPRQTLGAQKRAEMAQLDAEKRTADAKLRIEAVKPISQKFQEALEEDFKKAPQLPYDPIFPNGRSYNPLKRVPYVSDNFERIRYYRTLYDDYGKKKVGDGPDYGLLFHELGTWLRKEELALEVHIQWIPVQGSESISEMRMLLYGARTWEDPEALCVRYLNDRIEETKIVYY